MLRMTFIILLFIGNVSLLNSTVENIVIDASKDCGPRGHRVRRSQHQMQQQPLLTPMRPHRPVKREAPKSIPPRREPKPGPRRDRETINVVMKQAASISN